MIEKIINMNIGREPGLETRNLALTFDEHLQIYRCLEFAMRHLKIHGQMSKKEYAFTESILDKVTALY